MLLVPMAARGEEAVGVDVGQVGYEFRFDVVLNEWPWIARGLAMTALTSSNE